MKRSAYILLISGVISVPPSIWYLYTTDGEEALPFFLTFGSFIISFLGLSFLFFDKVLEKRKKTTWVILAIGILLYLLTALFAKMHWQGTGPLFCISTFFMAFTFLPLLTRNRVEKWKQHTRKAWHAYFLSIADLLSVSLLALGALFKRMQWPGGSIMLTVGAILFIASIIAWNRLFSKQIVLRKEAEEKVQKALEQLREQHTLVEEKQKEILDSIHYARRIQRSLMPTEKYIVARMGELRKEKK